MIKYADKFLHLPDSVYVMQTDLGEIKTMGYSLVEVVDNYKKSHPDLNSMYKIVSVINPHASDIEPEPQEMTCRELKDYLTPHVYTRHLILKPDFSELCMEYYALYYDEERSGGNNFCFDYGILSGDYELPQSRKIYKTDFRTDQRYMYPLNFDLVLMFDAPRNKPDDISTAIFDTGVCLMACSILDNHYYDYDSSCFPIASVSEFDAAKDFDVDKLDEAIW